MNLELAKQIAEEEITKHIPEWRFEFDRANRRMGCCHYRHKKITLSRSLTELNGEAKVRDTILHEIAHALVGARNGHNHIWRAKALEIGACGNRCYTTDDEDPLKVTQPKGTYTLVCPKCKKETQFWRKKKRESACGDCCRKYNGGYFSEDYVLIPKEEKDRAIYSNVRMMLKVRPSMAQIIANQEARREVNRREREEQ